MELNGFDYERHFLELQLHARKIGPLLQSLRLWSPYTTADETIKGLAVLQMT